MAKDIIPFTKAEEKIIEKIVEKRVKVDDRYPVISALVATFGLVSVFYGFEKMIDRVDLFVNHPWILLLTGITTLAVTGTVYKKLN